MRHITFEEIAGAADSLAQLLTSTHRNGVTQLYGVPRGGVAAAFAVQAAMLRRNQMAAVVDSPDLAQVIIDDLVDSGATRDRYAQSHPGKPFYALFNKTTCDEWLVFPWEQGDAASSATDIPTRLLQFIGEDVEREGLLETPHRVVKAWQHLFSGYGVEPGDVLKSFKDGAEGVDEMVLETDIPVYSHCEHHMAPIFGVAHVAYIPNGKVVGLSKLVRLVDVFARRLQVQERLTTQIAEALQTELEPLGVGVVLQCRHFCMESRGVGKSGVVTTTSSLRGAIKDEPSARAEFFSLIDMSKSRHNAIL